MIGSAEYRPVQLSPEYLKQALAFGSVVLVDKGTLEPQRHLVIGLHDEMLDTTAILSDDEAHLKLGGAGTTRYSEITALTDERTWDFEQVLQGVMDYFIKKPTPKIQETFRKLLEHELEKFEAFKARL